MRFLCSCVLLCTLASSPSIFAQADIGAVSTQQIAPAPPPPANASVDELLKSGDQYLGQKQYGDALEYYRAAAKLSPSSGFVQNRIGIVYLKQMRLKEAQKQFERASKLDRNFAEPVNNLGVVFYEQAMPQPPGRKVNENKLDHAIELYVKALKMKEASAVFHSNLGTALFKKKEYDRATTEYARALQLDPRVFDVKDGAGPSVHLITGDERARFSYTLARIYAQMGKTDESLAYLRKAIEDGYPTIRDVYKDEAFAAVRKDPRFDDLMAHKPESVPE